MLRYNPAFERGSPVARTIPRLVDSPVSLTRGGTPSAAMSAGASFAAVKPGLTTVGSFSLSGGTPTYSGAVKGRAAYDFLNHLTLYMGQLDFKRSAALEAKDKFIIHKLSLTTQTLSPFRGGRGSMRTCLRSARMPR